MPTKVLPGRLRRVLLAALVLLGARQCFTTPWNWNKSSHLRSAIPRAAEASTAISEEERQRLKAEFKEVIMAKMDSFPVPLKGFLPDYDERFAALGGLIKNLKDLSDIVEVVPRRAPVRYVTKVGDEATKKKVEEERAARIAAEEARIAKGREERAAKQKAAQASAVVAAETKAEVTEQQTEQPPVWLRTLRGSWNLYLKATPAEKRDVNDLIVQLTEMSQQVKEPRRKRLRKKAAEAEAEASG